jgi:hypothetical protein
MLPLVLALVTLAVACPADAYTSSTLVLQSAGGGDSVFRVESTCELRDAPDPAVSAFHALMTSVQLSPDRAEFGGVSRAWH